jgi:uncharacterized protein YdhG (YjbR/CyaY superfamily)
MRITPKRDSGIDAYIAAAPAGVKSTLRRIRSVIRRAAPGATETISYRIPAFRQRGILIYFAAFKSHIGLFPPVRGDARLEKALTPYRGPKGNLRFPLDEPIPYALIERIAKLRAKQDAAKARSSRASKASREKRGRRSLASARR